jgi:hypothetical protein
MSGPNRVLLVVIGVLGLVTVAVLALTVGRGVEEFDLDSPEGVAQAYLKAAFDGKFDEAANYFATESECDATDLDRAYIQEDVRISLVEVTTTADKGTVRINAEIADGSPFAGYYEEQHSLRVVREDDTWKLTGIPWPLYDCNNSKL